MILKLIYADRMKLKRSPIWLAFLFMPIVPALLGTLNYRANIGILKNSWYSPVSYTHLPASQGINILKQLLLS